MFSTRPGATAHFKQIGERAYSLVQAERILYVHFSTDARIHTSTNNDWKKNIFLIFFRKMAIFETYEQYSQSEKKIHLLSWTN